MHLQICYEKYTEARYRGFYAILIECDNNKNDKFFSPFFYSQLISEDNAWIDAEKLLSEEYLHINNIEYFIDEDTNQIIPIGIVEFCKENGKNDLTLAFYETKSLYKADQVLKNILKAIEIKYKTYDLAQKCLSRYVENVEI